MTIEFSLGRASHKSPVKLYNELENPGQKWHLHGYAAMAGNYLLMMFYTTVAGWMLHYFFYMAGGTFDGTDVEAVENIFNAMLADPYGMTGFMAVVVLLGFGVCSRGLQNGLEKVSKFMMLLLFYPALCIPHDARRGQMMFYKFDPTNIPDILGKVPMKLSGEYARCVINMNPFDEIKGYQGRTLYLHGTADDIVDVSYARTAKDLYPNCRYEEIENGTHGFRGKHDKMACDILREFMRL